MRVFVPGEHDARATCSRSRRSTACRSGTCGRACRRSKTSSPAPWARSSACRFMIRAIAATAATRARGGTRLAGDRPRRHPHVPAPSARSSACCWWPGSRSSSAPCQIYVADELPAGGVPRADRRDVPRVPRAAEHLRVLRHRLRRRRPDRQRSPRQRAADLPVEAADARSSTSPASWRSWRRSCCSSPGCRRCCCWSCRSCSPGSFDVRRARTSSCSRRSRVFSFVAGARRRRARCWRCRRCRRAAASSRSCTRRDLLHASAIYGTLRVITGIDRGVVGLVHRQPRRRSAT